MINPFSIRSVPASAIVISVPHAGRCYDNWQHQLRIPPEKLRPLEDPIVDTLVTQISNATLIISHVPRAVIDLNRDEYDLDPTMISDPIAIGRPSARARGGLGLIPSRLGNYELLWRNRLSMAEVTTRLASLHRPYHSAIEHALSHARKAHGIAILIDLHSMPSAATDYDIIIGDYFGRSSSTRVADFVEQLLIGEGITIARNHPYAGGAITQRHGKPSHNVHALQIELSRRLYLGDDEYSPSPKMAAISAMITRFITAIHTRYSQPNAMAAE